MPVNQVYKATGEKIIDISDSTVTAADLAQNVTAYDATGEKITGTGKLDDTKIYGIRINQAESDPVQSVIYLEDAVGMTPATMTADSFDWGSWANAFFIPKPCMLTFSGTVDYYLDPNDYTKKADGTASDVANQNYQGNAMMEFPKMYYKWKREYIDSQHDYVYFYISNKIQEGFSSFNINSTYQSSDRTYVGIYGGYQDSINSKYRSMSGVTLSSSNLGFKQNLYNLKSSIDRYSNSAYSGERFRVRSGVMGLLYILFKRLDVFWLLDSVNAEQTLTTGWGDNKGLFAVRPSYSYSESTRSLKMLGIEDFFCAPTRYIFDAYIYSSYLYIENNNISSSYATSQSQRGYVNRMLLAATSSATYGLYPARTFNGSSSTYWCTALRIVSSSSTTYPLAVGANYDPYGLSYFVYGWEFNNAETYTYSDSRGGAGRLCYYPDATT